jgi:hypothetical protein
MDYSTFKSLQLLLFWGSAFAFCVWQLRVLQRMRRQRVLAERERLAPRRLRSVSQRRVERS